MDLSSHLLAVANEYPTTTFLISYFTKLNEDSHQNFLHFSSVFSLGFALNEVDICAGTMAILFNKMRRALMG
jgi:hypothetical protein